MSQGKMEITSISNIGRVVKGTIFDCNRKFLDRRLKDLDSRLYTSWNQFKNNGNGCWEVRILPLKKTPVPYGEYNGAQLYRLEYVENSNIHHIMDVPCLHENILNQLRAMDTTVVGNSMQSFTDWLEDEELTINTKAQNKISEDLRLQLKEERKYVKIFYEAVRSGVNPSSFFTGNFKS